MMFGHGWRDRRTNNFYVLTFLTLIIYGYSLDEGSHYTNTWVVEFKSDRTDVEVNDIAKKHGFLNYGKVFADLNLYEFHHPHVTKRSTYHAEEHTNLLESHVHIRSAEQQIGKIRVKRDHVPEPHFRINDPLWMQTWYLRRGIDSNTQYDMNVIPAWNKGYTGKGIVVTILDDGIEHDHPDLKKNYDPQASTDINNKDDDPMPRYDYSNENRHGTRCAGEVAAEANNNKCSVGVAYEAKIGGIRMLDGSVTDLVESNSLKFNPNHVDIYSASWGPDDNGRTVDGPGKLAKKAFVDGVEKGRNGKGNIFLWASGNGGSHSDSCACDGYTNSIYTLSVSSASEHNTPPWYLEQCASTLATTYSSGANANEKQIVTTDLRKSCTSTHTGTSASAPLAAGLVAVMLDANNKMTWRDVQYVTMASANPVPLEAQGDFKTNGADRRYSHKFGFGLMDCAKMADTAHTWRKVPPQLIKHMPKGNPDANLKSGYSKSVTVPGCAKHDVGCIRYLEHVQLVLTMNSVKRGKLSVKVTSPSGTESTLLPNRRSDGIAGSFTAWPFLSVHFWGENPEGTWHFEINNGGQAGKVTSYQLVLYGVSIDPFDMSRPLSQEEIVCDDSCAGTDGRSCFGSGADQCKQCKDDLYKVEDTNMCVASCTDGYYEADKECKLCYKSCATCTGAVKTDCTSCSSKLLLDNEGHCIEECPIGFFPDVEHSRCLPCKTNCTSCSSLDDCLKCGPGFDVVSGQCKVICANREYRDDSGECVPCTDENCALCEDNETCRVCDPDFNLYHLQCVGECPDHTYVVRNGRDGGQNECKDCHDSCATCNEDMDNNCLSCIDRYQLTSSHTCVVNTTCQPGWFRPLDVGACTKCHESCDTCHGISDLDCTSCKDQKYRKDGACVKDCGDGLYPFVDKNDGHASCQHCHLSCANCTNDRPDSCTTCPSHSYLNGSVCHPICPDGKYLKFVLHNADSHEAGFDRNVSCANCSAECRTCGGPRTADCNSCVRGKVLGPAGSCLNSCPDGTFKKAVGLSMENVGENFICHACNPQCLTCNGGQSSDCLRCKDPQVFFKGQCVQKQSCHKKQYYNSTANECLHCYQTCVDCTGPSELECTSCSEDLLLYTKPFNDDALQQLDHQSLTGQCVECCAGGQIKPGLCCDCRIEDTPICEKPDAAEFTTEASKQHVDLDHKNFVIIVVFGILSAVVLYVVVFLLLQYRSYGRCAWQTTSNKLLVDGPGSIEYRSLTDKDNDILFAADDGFRGPNKFGNDSSHLLGYGSD